MIASNLFCTQKIIKNITVNPLPIIVLGNDTATCNLPVILKSGVNNATYLWSNGKSTKNIKVKNTGTFSVIVTDVKGCSNTDTINVIIYPLPAISIGNDTSTCNIPILLDAGTGNSSYLWNNGATTQVTIVNTSANYSVIVADSNGCTNADTIAIVINQLPAKPTITQNISLLTSSGSTGNQWLMNGNIIAGAISGTYPVTLTGWYSVEVTDSNGCNNLSDSIYMDLTGLHDVSNSKNDIRIIPNPATTSFVISGFGFRADDLIIITDAFGKIIYQNKITQPTSNLKLETSNFVSGVYFVNVNTAKAIYSFKLVKM